MKEPLPHSYLVSKLQTFAKPLKFQVSFVIVAELSLSWFIPGEYGSLREWRLGRDKHLRNKSKCRPPKAGWGISSKKTWVSGGKIYSPTLGLILLPYLHPPFTFLRSLVSLACLPMLPIWLGWRSFAGLPLEVSILPQTSVFGRAISKPYSFSQNLLNVYSMSCPVCPMGRMQRWGGHDCYSRGGYTGRCH